MIQKSKVSFVLPALIYALLIGTTFSPDVQPVLVKAFSASPLGLPVAPVVAGAVAVLFLPFAFSLHHFMLIAGRAAADGHSLSKVGLLAYAASVGQRYPELRRSQLICFAGLIYFVLVCAAWIVYADSIGI
ncbi:hypothetical protein CSC74_03605 [Pseudoxanthomonas yeongjuensis]|uniref:hypothetical protein n=1 Tax=Pseudoxanthomonas yeongjuensis TaxID=377616 RepID=UPI001391159E|nr:hypothetical protein [Pseudoxanthomonas yeongjuensis]KAF1717996.1 hypothetical protein CSC74_03605 [Pseudoxanthomonas yeongjuensis]